MFHFLWNFTTFSITLCMLITVHECGHFFIARYFGVMIKSFSIGFGKKIWSWYDKYGTEYTISAIPFGGYVKMFDEKIDIISPELNHKIFKNKRISQRAAIIISGPIFNFLFSVLIYWVIFIIGFPSYKPVIGGIIQHSILDNGKIFPGTEIKFIDEVKTNNWNEIRQQLIKKIEQKQIFLGISSVNSNNIKNIKLNLYQWKFVLNKQDDPITKLGIIPMQTSSVAFLIIEKIHSKSQAMISGLKPGDRIIKIDKTFINSLSIFIKKIQDNSKRDLKLVIERNNCIKYITLLKDNKSLHVKNIKNFFGIVPKIHFISIKQEITKKYNLFSALIKALEKTWNLIKITVNILKNIVIGNIKLNSLRGPIFIAQEASISAKNGFIEYLMFLALTSINLGVINLFPLPILDGGHILFLIIEKLNRKEISEKLQNIFYNIGLFFLIILTCFVFFNDFLNLK